MISMTFTLWIVFNNVFYNPTDGFVSELDEMAQKDMTGEFLDRWNQHHDNDANSFGFFGALITGVLFICLIAAAFDEKKVEQ